jgi:hypothetical protein
MENAGLQGFAEIGLILFLIAFVLVILRVVLIDKETADERSRLPLDDEDSPAGQ